MKATKSAASPRDSRAASLTDGLRKAAIFVGSLDRRAADLVLDQMDPRIAARVRTMMVELDAVDPAEQKRVLEEFSRKGPRSADPFPAGIEIDDRLARQFVRPPLVQTFEDAPPSAPPKLPPFRFLREAESDKLVKILASERPQVIALVLSHLPPGQAGSVLVRLAPHVQVDVIRRLVDLEETDPEILHEVERGLESRLSEQIRMQRRRVAGLSAVTGILQASERRVGVQILDNLAAYDRALAERLSPGPFEFADLVEMSDRALASIVAAADPEILVLALVGAPPDWVDRFLACYPSDQARAVRFRADHFGPIRLSDVEEARKQLAELARALAIEGRLGLPDSRTAALSSL